VPPALPPPPAFAWVKLATLLQDERYLWSDDQVAPA
jgi:hypothetical protein